MIFVMVFLIAFAASQSVGTCVLNDELPTENQTVDNGGDLYLCVPLDNSGV